MYCIELIDTCWDVNQVPTRIGRDEHAELIDTCWDVNSLYTASKT